MVDTMLAGIAVPNGKGRYGDYWHRKGFPTRASRQIHYGEVLSMMNREAKKAAYKARMRAKSKQHDGGNGNLPKRHGVLPPWQLDLFQKFQAIPRTSYKWAEAKVLQNVASKEAADKVHSRMISCGDDSDIEHQLDYHHESGGRLEARQTKRLLCEFVEFLNLLKDSGLANEHLKHHPLVPLLSLIEATLKSNAIDSTEAKTLLEQRDEYVAVLRNSWLADKFLMHYRLIRPVNFTNDTATQTTVKVTNAIKIAIDISHKEKQIRNKHVREQKARNARSQINKLRPRYPPRPSRRPFWLMKDPEVSAATYAAFRITTQVHIAGQWRTAVIDQTRDSAIGFGLALLTQKSSENQPKKSVPPPRRTNYHLFQRNFNKPSTKIAMTLVTADNGEEGCLSDAKDHPKEITPVLTYGFDPNQPIVLGKDLILEEQLHSCGCVTHYLESYGGRTHGIMRLLDGTTYVKVVVDFPEKTEDSEEYLFADQEKIWWEYWSPHS